jgi:uroporphyrin-III C-methyltransferase
MKPRKLILIGAGPGDPSLITLKGIEALKKADVVLYDALVHPDLLNHTKKSAIKIYVGKRAGKHSMEQEEINQLIVESAFGFGTVARLKGGDPFVLGRGYEEIEYARKFGIEIEVIPGVSSATALTGLQQIPITARGINDSFWVINANNNEQQLEEDLQKAAQTNATIIIMMGFKKLNQIIDIFKSCGHDNLPVAVIQNGSLENEKIAIGTIDTILKEVKKNNLGTPALIVIGEVVKLHAEFQKKLGNPKNIFIEKQLTTQAVRWIDKKNWTIRSGLPEPPGILPIEHLAKLRFRRAIRSYIKNLSEKQRNNKSTFNKNED